MAILSGIGLALVRYLDRPLAADSPFTPNNPEMLRASLRPGDVILVEGNNFISGIIKYLTQSTWSHAALYIGPSPGAAAQDGEPHVLVEANIGEGVVSAPLSKYFRFHTRVCRPVALSASDCEKVCRYAADRIGLRYDLKNIIDLLKYLFPLPVRRSWRRGFDALGSRDPSRIMCSALIAEAFKTVRHPILSRTRRSKTQGEDRILETAHCSFYTPRDFDLSPYFEVLKPAIHNDLPNASSPAQPAVVRRPLPDRFTRPASATVQPARAACAQRRRAWNPQRPSFS